MSWKTVDLPLDMFSSGAEIVGLEELVDYNPEDINKLLKKPSKKKVQVSEKSSSRKRRNESAESDEHTGQNDDYEEREANKKLSKKRTSKKSSSVKRKARRANSDKSDDSQSDDTSEDENVSDKKLYKSLIPRSAVVDVNAEEPEQPQHPKQDASKENAEDKSQVQKPVLKKPSASVVIDQAKVEKMTPNWKGLGLPAELLLALHENNFLNPTEIQKQAIPAALAEHRDVIAAAETGSGKTLAYGLPLLAHILEKIRLETEEEQNQRPLGLILVPTRELAVQVKHHIDKAGSRCDGIFTGLIVGGLSVEKQQRILSQKPPVLIATPGRLWQMVREGVHGLDQISTIRYLVVDEADRIVEKAHFAELKLLIDYINEHQPERQKRQTLLFSATLTFAQYDVKNQATDLAVLQVKLRNLMEALSMKNRPKIIDLSPAGTTTRSLVEAKVVCDGGEVEKDAVLYAILSQYPGRTLVFANAIATVRKISNNLRLLFSKPQKKAQKRPSAPSRPILLLHAQLRQRIRLKYLDRFRDEPNAILVASDVAARGLDIPNIEHVIHYHVPNNAESYVHRSGRTARLSTEGLSILLVDPKVEAGRFWRLMANLCRRATSEEAKAADVADFEIDPSLLAQCRERVAVCRQLESLKHQERKLLADKKWEIEGGSDFEPGSSDSEAVRDDDDDLDYEKDDTTKSRQIKATIKQLEIKLAHLLAVPLKSRAQVALTRYPSALGQPISVESTTAVATGKIATARRAIDHIAATSSRKGVGNLAKQIALAAKIERRKEKQKQKQEEMAKEKAKKRDRKKNLKRKKKDDGDEKFNNNNKDFVFYD